jgi:hypothetical protein
MKRLLSLMVASMLIPSTVLASSIRPGTRVTHDSLNSGSKVRSKSPLCLGETEKFTEKCDIVIDETGVEGPAGKIVNVVQWKTEEKDFNYGGAMVGGAAGGTAGFAAGLGSCMIVGPLCLITAPTLMGAGMGGGAELGGKGQGRFFTIIGDTAKGDRVIQEYYITSGKAVKQGMKALLMTTKLAEGEVRD